MIPVSYSHQFDYCHDAEGRQCPLLRFVASSVVEPSRSLDLEAGLDSGAERSLFSGRIGLALGLDVLEGPKLVYSSMAGSLLAVLHTVRLIHEDLGAFELEVGFSTSEIPRNVLGRDFFDLVQIGFREHQLRFFITPSS